ncbi:MAG: NADP-dependent oxidoreductase [Desulfobacteraceae bacterium]|nr:MAG: NADP-dependent oxidoreductase [Desulfobacteraceae bacterium]
MKACFIEDFGGREKLKVADLPRPHAGEGEVLVRIHAAGVNPVDFKIREGWLKDLFPHRFPLILGWDLAGVVEAVGPNAGRFKPGDSVYAYARLPELQKGTYAEYMALPEGRLARKPNRLSMIEAASIPLTALTAYQALEAGRLQRGESVFILGASGGVGTFAVQLAAIRGARVIGLSSAKNSAYIKSLGADAAIDYERGDFIQSAGELLLEGADLVLDCRGGDTLARGMLCVRPGGRVVSIIEIVDAEDLKKRDVRFAYIFVEPNAQQLDHIRELIEGGRFRTHVSHTFSLDEAAKAHEQMETGHTRGKIVLQTA